MRKTMSLALLALCLAFSVGWVARAQPAGQAEDPIKRRVQERWEMVKERIELATVRFENNYQRHLDVYQRIKTRVADMVKSLEEKGYDVSTLREDLATLETMVGRFAKDYASLMEKLKEILALSSGEAAGVLLRLLSEARELLRLVRKDVLDIRLFWQEQVRVDLRELA